MSQQAQLISETSKSLDKAVVQVKILQNEMARTKFFPKIYENSFFKIFRDVFTVNYKKITQNKSKPIRQEPEKNHIYPLLIVPKPGKTINKEQLLTQLYGQNKEFKYELKLNSQLDTTFYRERNFRSVKFVF